MVHHNVIRKKVTAKLGLLCCTVLLLYSTQQLLQRESKYAQELAKRNVSSLLNHIMEDTGVEAEGAVNLPDCKDWEPYKLAVIVPFRNRFEELLEFVPWIHKFLNNQKIPHKIVIVNQIDTHRFNRAALVNIGYLKTKDECDYMVMNDVDLLPNNPELLYTFPDKGPYHAFAPEYHPDPTSRYKTYIGGVLLMSNQHFELCHGMSNKFWGWGKEDDELYRRFQDHQLTVYRPRTGLATGYQTFIHNHNKEKRPRDKTRYGDQGTIQFQRDKETGYDTLKYHLESEKKLIIDRVSITVYNVELHCDIEITPWCDHK